MASFSFWFLIAAFIVRGTAATGENVTTTTSEPKTTASATIAPGTNSSTTTSEPGTNSSTASPEPTSSPCTCTNTSEPGTNVSASTATTEANSSTTTTEPGSNFTATTPKPETNSSTSTPGTNFSTTTTAPGTNLSTTTTVPDTTTSTTTAGTTTVANQCECAKTLDGTSGTSGWFIDIQRSEQDPANVITSAFMRVGGPVRVFVSQEDPDQSFCVFRISIFVQCCRNAYYKLRFNQKNKNNYWVETRGQQAVPQHSPTLIDLVFDPPMTNVRSFRLGFNRSLSQHCVGQPTLAWILSVQQCKS